MSTDAAISEFKRKKRVADMLITAHSILGERYRRISVAFDIGLMLASFIILFLSLLELAAPEFLVGMIGDRALYLVVGAAIVIFVLSVVEWRVAWEGKAESHFLAARNYSSIKGEIVGLLSRGISDEDSEAAKIEYGYDRLGMTSVKIPNGKFVSLKRMHLKKVALSKLLDNQPFAISFLIRLKLTVKDSIKGWSEID